jgi:hypothetical protein
MHDPQYQEFQGRLARLGNTQRPGRRAQAASIAQFIPTARGSDRIPLWRSLGVIALTIVLVKGVILAQIGPADYNDRLARAEGGSVVQQVSTYVMQIDPITEWIAGTLHAVLNELG